MTKSLSPNQEKTTSSCCNMFLKVQWLYKTQGCSSSSFFQYICIASCTFTDYNWDPSKEVKQSLCLPDRETENALGFDEMSMWLEVFCRGNRNNNKQSLRKSKPQPEKHTMLLISVQSCGKLKAILRHRGAVNCEPHLNPLGAHAKDEATAPPPDS